MYMGILWSADQGVSSYSEGVIVNVIVTRFAIVSSFRGTQHLSSTFSPSNNRLRRLSPLPPYPLLVLDQMLDRKALKSPLYLMS